MLLVVVFAPVYENVAGALTVRVAAVLDVVDLVVRLLLFFLDPHVVHLHLVLSARHWALVVRLLDYFWKVQLVVAYLLDIAPSVSCIEADIIGLLDITLLYLTVNEPVLVLPDILWGDALITQLDAASPFRQVVVEELKLMKRARHLHQ